MQVGLGPRKQGSKLRMRFVSTSGRYWLREAWRHKASVIGGLLAAVSLSLAHYAGFLINLPMQILAVAGLSLVKGVTATFIFYVLFCAVVARVFTSVVQLVALPFLAAADRVSGGFRRNMSWSQRRRFVRSHTQTIKWEGFVWIVFQACLFVFFVLALYVNFKGDWASGLGLLLSIVLVILAGLVRFGFLLQPKPKVFIRKVRTRRTRTGRAASAAFVTATAGLVIAAFSIGVMRANLLRDQAPYRIVSKDFSGEAVVIASSDSALLLFQKKDTAVRYVYLTSEFAASMASKPVFSPIGPKENP
jgi:hypothetical protein